ncbi:MAG TPA: hypothetical protein VG013_21045 [Gemmataceae bacterium]|jgi:hypothetical protein|nr:hypothetical protein [Gemmataceae bacterium]
MERVVFGRWRLCCDREATRRAYKFIEIGGPEACGCCHCRNFAAARGQVYPGEVRSLFEELGIDSCREAEVYQMGRLASGLHLYGGWFHCLGRIEQEGKEVGKFDLEGGTGPFNLFFHDKPALVPGPFQGLPLLQLEFTAEVPWVLQESEPE